MARINIEDSLFKEKAWERLIIKLGSRRAALGALCEAFMLAQKHYLTTDNDRLIPLTEWQREEMAQEIIECGFAEVREKGIYVRGSEEQFGWLVQRSEAGKKSAQAKAEKKQRDDVSNASTSANGRSTVVNDSQPLPLTLSLTQEESTKYNTQLSVVAGSHSDVPALPKKSAIQVFKSEKELLESIPHATVRRWCELYPDEEYLRRETLKAFNYYENNKRKQPRNLRGWVQALSTWFERGWKFYVKTIPANAPRISEDQMAAILRGEVS